MTLTEKTIKELVADNHLLASAFDLLGIKFYNYTEHTLEDICKERGWKMSMIVDRIKESLSVSNKGSIEFNALPVDLLIEYLKHSHYIFIKQRLPFITDLVHNFKGENPEIKNELKLIFPLFLQDFIEHVYEEEDTLFTYILELNKALKYETVSDKLQALMLKHSIGQYQQEHMVHDDQLKGLRLLTNNFEIDNEFDLNTKVVLAELKKFDAELRYHAKIENDILFPRALEFERNALILMNSKVALN